MKTLKIDKISPPDKDSVFKARQLYYVYLGNRQKRSFSNETDAKAFIAETNRMLNAKLYELNFLYSDILRLYRASWIYFEAGKISGLNNIEYRCTQAIQVIDRQFNLMVERAGWENGNHMVFSHFTSIIRELNTISDLLKKVFKRRGLTGSVYEADSYSLRLQYIQTALLIYPNEIPLHLDTTETFIEQKMQII